MKKRILSPHLTIFRGFPLALKSILTRIFAFIVSLILIFYLAYNLIYSNMIYSHIAISNEFNTNIDILALLFKLNIYSVFYLFNFHNINILSLFVGLVLFIYLRVIDKLKFIYFVILLKFILV